MEQEREGAKRVTYKKNEKKQQEKEMKQQEGRKAKKM